MLKVSFDPINKLIEVTEAPNAGVSVIDVRRDLYSAAKYHWLNDSTANKFQFPFLTIGGNDLGGGLSAGSYYFLRTDLGWKIKPYEGNHELQLTGNLYPINAEDTIFEPVQGAFTVAVRLERSQLTQALSVSDTQSSSYNGLEVDSYLQASVYVDAERGTPGTAFPVGTPSTPAIDVDSAVAIAANYNLNSFIIAGDVTLDANAPHRADWQGVGPIRSRITFNGSPTDGEFTKMIVGGTLSGLAVFEECSLRDLNEFSGIVKSSFIAGHIVVAADATAVQFFDCKTIDISSEADPQASPAVIDLINYDGPVALRGYTGPIRISNLVNGNRVSCDMYSGSVYLDNTCTNGIVDIGGVARVWNQSGPGCVVQELHVETQRMKELWQRFGLDPNNPMTSTQNQVSFNNTIIDVTGDGVNSSTVTRRP